MLLLWYDDNNINNINKRKIMNGKKGENNKLTKGEGGQQHPLCQGLPQ